MDPKLILVEGLPGAGKTTVVERIKQQLEEQGKKVVFYEGKGTHPADMAWQAYLTKDEYHRFVADCLTLWTESDQEISDDELIRRIEAQCQVENGHVTMAYRMIDFPDARFEVLREKLSKKEIFGGHVTFEEFRELHLIRWNKFAKGMQMRKEVAIFESAFLQSQVFELRFFFEKSDEEIMDYLVELLGAAALLQPRMIYIMTQNVGELVDSISAERFHPEELEKDWFTCMEQWTKNTVYGKRKQLSGRDGIIDLLTEKQRIDYMALRKIGIPITWITRDE